MYEGQIVHPRPWCIFITFNGLISPVRMALMTSPREQFLVELQSTEIFYWHNCVLATRRYAIGITVFYLTSLCMIDLVRNAKDSRLLNKLSPPHTHPIYEATWRHIIHVCVTGKPHC